MTAVIHTPHWQWNYIISITQYQKKWEVTKLLSDVLYVCVCVYRQCLFNQKKFGMCNLNDITSDITAVCVHWPLKLKLAHNINGLCLHCQDVLKIKSWFKVDSHIKDAKSECKFSMIYLVFLMLVVLSVIWSWFGVILGTKHINKNSDNYSSVFLFLFLFPCIICSTSPIKISV